MPEWGVASLSMGKVKLCPNLICLGTPCDWCFIPNETGDVSGARPGHGTSPQSPPPPTLLNALHVLCVTFLFSELSL